jgi:hypothetical protein
MEANGPLVLLQEIASALLVAFLQRISKLMRGDRTGFLV